jgi:hypothetical protein
MAGPLVKQKLKGKWKALKKLVAMTTLLPLHLESLA